MTAADRTSRWLERHDGELLELVAELVRRPSENRPPRGDETACQELVADYLGRLGLEPDCFRPDEVPGIEQHPLWWPGRDYEDRRCVVARRAGAGGGRSLLFTGHVDVVPALGEGRRGWWDAEVVDGRLFGRGALDMKAGVACYLHALRCLCECEIPLHGDLLVETVVDEEYGGANGTLACRLRGGEPPAAAVLPEPTALRVCNATRGGRQYRLNASGGLGAMPLSEDPQPSALVALGRIAVALAEAERGRGTPLIQMLLRSGAELPWGTAESIPADGILEFWAEILPGTTLEELERELRGIVERVDTGGVSVAWEERTRFLEAALIPADAPIVEALRRALGGERAEAPPVTAPFACDAFVLNACGVPTVVCGPGGENAHAPDEHVLLDDVRALAGAYVRLALDWCGVAAGARC